MFQIIVAVLMTHQVIVYAPLQPDGTRTPVTFDTQEACETFVAADEFFQKSLAGLQEQITGPVAVSCMETPAKEEGSPH